MANRATDLTEQGLSRDGIRSRRQHRIARWHSRAADELSKMVDIRHAQEIGRIKRGVKFRSLTEAIDTETPTGRAMWQMIGVLAELERSLISERTRAGVKDALRRGAKFGRKPKLTAQQITHARKLIDAGERREDVAALLRVDRTTLYRAFAA